jgi:hypothetical protein
MMKTVTMEELLTWAFVHELPKGGGVDGLDNANSAWRMLEASSWGKITSFAELGTLIDRSGGTNYFIEQGEPHDDAVTVGRAVAQLGRCDIVLPRGWNPLADWPDADGQLRGLAEAAVARVRKRIEDRTQARRGSEMVSLVVGTAILSRPPDWSSEPSKVKMVERGGQPAWFVKRMVADTLGNKHEIEVDGRSGRDRRPVRGAYRKFELSVAPDGDILSRLDHQIWVAVNRRLEAELTGKLIGHRIVSEDRSMTPWLDREGAGVAIVGSAIDKPAEKISQRA